MSRGERVSPAAVLERVLAGPPIPLRSLCPAAPAELVAICDKAMARDPADRYADMQHMAEDLRAFLERRVVRAYRTGPFVELGKWVSRNRGLALMIGAALVMAIGSLLSTSLLLAEGSERLQLLADSRAPADLAQRFGELSSGRPEDAPVLEHWLVEARELVARHEAYERELGRLRARALPWDRAAPREAAAERQRRARLAEIEKVMGYYRDELQRLEREGGLSEEGLTSEEVAENLSSLGRQHQLSLEPGGRLTWTFASERDQVRHDALEKVVTQLEPFLDATDVDGLVSLAQGRLAFVSTVEQRTLRDAAERWDLAIASIADREQCPVSTTT